MTNIEKAKALIGSFTDVPTTYYDLFRVENGYIAEHWDVMET